MNRWRWLEGSVDSCLRARADDLLGRFLTGRSDRTLNAYRADLDDFARSLGTTRLEAVARLFAGGAGNARRLALEYAVDQRRRDRAPATIARRLCTLRTLVRTACGEGIIGWQLSRPGEDEISAAMGCLPVTDTEHYLLPRHASEIDRLDVQHYAMREALRCNFVAPLEAPARILDVGCGTGQWGFEMCEELQPALVVGLDLVSGKPDQPAGYRFVRGNVLQGLPFADARFDFVHQRFLVTGLPLASWPEVVHDLSRVTRPGGWIELVEVPFAYERPGPAAQRLLELVHRLLAALGLDTSDVVYRSLDMYLRQAGMVNVVRHEASLPIGRWGGRAGSLMVTDCRAGATRVCEVLQARGWLSAEQAGDLIRRALEEWEHGEMAVPVAVAIAQRPG